MASRSRTRVYNSWWSYRADCWSRLEEAVNRVVVAQRRDSPIDGLVEPIMEQCTALVPIEQFWAFPGPELFARVQELAASADYPRLLHLVASINRALVTESYRHGSMALRDNQEASEDDLPELEHSDSDRPYFEVLVVDTLTPEQEHDLREEMRSWRRADDKFVYELVVVGSGPEALVAMRLNANIQACVIRRRFSHGSLHDLTDLDEFIDPDLSAELADHTPDERAQILARRMARERPEVDLYLMTEVGVEEMAGRLSHHFRRVFHAREGSLDLHQSILAGVMHRYRTPFFDALRAYAHRPTGAFHALPISQGKSIVGTHWIRDMVGFYGLDIFLAETSATGGGLDSLLEPTGPLRDAQDCAAETFGSRQTFFVTNGTSTANKIVAQALVGPGDIVLVDRNCHQSHHYGLMLAGAQVSYLDAYPLNEFAMYGAVPIREIKQRLLDLRAAGKLDRVRLLMLTNCTFDGVVYDVGRVMEECLAIKPDLVFLWDEAWWAFARFHPIYRPRTGMRAARTLVEKLRTPEYRAAYEEWDQTERSDRELVEDRLMPDPDTTRVRVYSTQSTHKTLTSLRQGSMIHVHDQDFAQKSREAFHEAYMAHTSTSPNYQILASLDLGRRQAALEGFELVQRQLESAMRLRDAIDNHPLLSKYMHCLSTAEMIPDEYRESHLAHPLRSGLHNMIRAWSTDEFVMDPTRISLYIGLTGIDGATFKQAELMDRFNIQINKTSRNTVLFMTNIGTSRSSVAYLIEVLVSIVREIDERKSEASRAETIVFERAVARLTNAAAPLPDFSGFHEAFRDPSEHPTPEGDVRRAFFLSYDDTNCEYLLQAEAEAKLAAGGTIVSATYVTPYPPGFPVLVPGQVFSTAILEYMGALDTPEVHGYNPVVGYRVYTDAAVEIAMADRARLYAGSEQ
ncbi:aminotransferase class I/II-fold pyridoxal phosphate-dependent enzyme [Flexivirga caeni]|uniref:aminotransferase class I/II-fold pyridoxal phosphate-dependent enzyme n=1 Tax=Flexivirga caeni TaxID=2294115 RepID=UPI001FE59554|nr:ornithine decarboxylase [Flexivirga caeni]